MQGRIIAVLSLFFRPEMHLVIGFLHEFGHRSFCLDLMCPRYADDPGKDAIGLPWRTLATTPEETARIGELLS